MNRSNKGALFTPIFYTAKKKNIAKNKEKNIIYSIDYASLIVYNEERLEVLLWVLK